MRSPLLRQCDTGFEPCHRPFGPIWIRDLFNLLRTRVLALHVVVVCFLWKFQLCRMKGGMVVDAGDTKTRSAETGWFYAVVKDTLIYCCRSEYRTNTAPPEASLRTKTRCAREPTEANAGKAKASPPLHHSVKALHKHHRWGPEGTIGVRLLHWATSRPRSLELELQLFGKETSLQSNSQTLEKRHRNII